MTELSIGFSIRAGETQRAGLVLDIPRRRRTRGGAPPEDPRGRQTPLANPQLRPTGAHPQMIRISLKRDTWHAVQPGSSSSRQPSG